MRKILTVTIPALLLFAAPAWAQYDQVAVVGLGLGAHTYSTIDEVREGSAAFDNDDELASGGMSQLYGEWYFLGPMGVGLRGISISSSRSYIYNTTTIDHTVTVSATLVTAHWVPLRFADDYARIGLLAGAGGAGYESKVTVSDSTSPNVTLEGTESTSGTAGLVGAYIDWGGEAFGARFGGGSLSTQLDDLNGAEVDGSGTHFYLDLRWAFQ